MGRWQGEKVRLGREREVAQEALGFAEGGDGPLERADLVSTSFLLTKELYPENNGK